MDNFLSAICLLLMCGGCSARVVTVSPGPLIRVEGQPVSIRCDVIEYGGPREQDFEWMMSREPTGQKIKIISTFDAGYSHPSLSKRVASGDISVVHLQDNEAELKIAEVKPMDAGFYWCQTPSTDSVISGNYEAQVQLIVISNTLSVAPWTPPPVVSAGGDLTLTCNVTRKLTQATYLSMTWSVKKGGTSEKLLTFGPDVNLVAAPQLTKRFMDGGIRMVPGKDGALDLVISKVAKSDEGVYECSGAEWAYEASEWVKIVESTKEMGPVAVASVEPQDKCTYVAVGANFTVPLNHPLTIGNRLRWNNNGRVIYDRLPDQRLRAGKAEDILDDGSLNLRNLLETMSGLYTPEIYLQDEKLVPDLKSLNLCVIAGVKKPNVTMDCQNNNTTVKFTCMTEDSCSSCHYEWLQNENLLNEVKGKSLRKVARDVETDLFTCRVSNPVSTLKSEPVTQNCYNGQSYVWIQVVRGGLCLLLIVSFIIIFLCYRARIKTQRTSETRNTDGRTDCSEL
ncbi:immunoglobulin superfamily member 8-like [Parambassis ranga]|uniref:immunoglobulin superfamily member 8-like n=1 Tax=Parambassis ranga TaxID=210632 RepID=UPI001041BEED|nr:immunoglobulin superfamily member 8-like [Parambassis ranga]